MSTSLCPHIPNLPPPNPYRVLRINTLYFFSLVVANFFKDNNLWSLIILYTSYMCTLHLSSSICWICFSTHLNSSSRNVPQVGLCIADLQWSSVFESILIMLFYLKDNLLDIKIQGSKLFSFNNLFNTRNILLYHLTVYIAVKKCDVNLNLVP